jgi:pyruvate/2-oxoacid:ferredoxin oxidoreductase alpha subunit
VTEFAEKTWAVRGVDTDRRNLISSIELDPDDLERHNRKLQSKYEIIENNEVRYEEYRIDDAEFVAVGYGIVSRMIHTAVDQLREEGVKVGMLRPITLMPFPKVRLAELAAMDQVKAFSVIELSNGQMVEDVRLAVSGSKPVEFYGRMGGNVPSIKELVHEIKRMMRVL